MSLQVPFTDLLDAAKCVVKALFIREKYINRSMQNFCKTTAHALEELGMKSEDFGVYDDVAETPVDNGMLADTRTHSVGKPLNSKGNMKHSHNFFSILTVCHFHHSRF